MVYKIIHATKAATIHITVLGLETHSSNFS